MIKMISSFVLFAFVFGAQLAMGEVENMSCVGGESDKGTLAFEYNFSTHTITFSDVSGFPSTDILTGTAFGATSRFTYDKNAFLRLEVLYDWYYTADYVFSFTEFEPYKGPGQKVTLLLEGNDDDGSAFSGVKYDCVTK